MTNIQFSNKEIQQANTSLMQLLTKINFKLNLSYHLNNLNNNGAKMKDLSSKKTLLYITFGISKITEPYNVLYPIQMILTKVNISKLNQYHL